MTLEAGKEMDRRCVMNWLIKICKDPTVAFNTHSDAQQKEYAHDALVMLKEQDAVVRCKDCKHCYVNRDTNVSYNECELNHNRIQSDYWYCGDGDRKEGEQDDP